MEQLYNAMLAGMQIPQAAPPSQKGEASQKDSFQKLLEQKRADAPQTSEKEKGDAPQNTQKTQDAQKTQETQETGEPQKLQTAVPKDGKILEEQMTLAAMLMMQNPLAVEVAGENQQVPEDSNLEEGLAIVGCADNEEGGFETASWVSVAAGTGENPGEPNAVAGEWTETQNKLETSPETQAEAPEEGVDEENPSVEIKVETGKAEFQKAETSDAEETPDFQGADTETPVFEDVRAVPVKVGEASKTEEAAEPMEKQIGPKLTEALRSGETRVEIQLNPENLGKVTVEMTWSRDGGLLVQVHAENSRTQNLLEKNTAGLEALLSRETQQEVRVEVPRQEESQRQDLYEQQQEQHRRHQQEERRKQESSGEDFLQQLRLGLIPLEGE